MKKTGAYIVAIAGGITLGMLIGCVNLQREYPVRKYYVLEVKPENTLPPLEDGPVVQVQLFRASPGFENTEFVYRTGDSNYESDFYNVFFIQPADQIRSLASEWLEDVGRARAVIDRASRLRPTHVIEGNLVEMYGDFRDKENPRAVIMIDFLLMDVRPLVPKIICSKSYREEIPIPESTAAALIVGWEEGLRKIFTEFEEDVPANAPPAEPDQGH
ncbi:MAG: hypothetical protein V1789_01425 [PVC group bacterium]